MISEAHVTNFTTFLVKSTCLGYELWSGTKMALMLYEGVVRQRSHKVRVSMCNFSLMLTLMSHVKRYIVPEFATRRIN